MIFEESIFPYSHTFNPFQNKSTGILGSSPTISKISPSIMTPSVQDSLITISSPTTNPTSSDQAPLTPSPDQAPLTPSPDQAPLTSSPQSTDSDINIIDQSSSDLISPNSTPPLKTKSLTEIYSQTQPVTHHPLPECFSLTLTFPVNQYPSHMPSKMLNGYKQ